jgi:uncharacterized protein (DUF2336 family)
MSYPSLIAELEAAVQTGTPEKRVETLRRVTGLFLDQSNQLNEQQIAVFDDVLLHLVQRIEHKALVQLSDSLAPVDNAPIEVVRRLSRDDDIAVAGPILTQSNRLTDEDLVDLAQHKGQGHLLAISGRTSLSEVVTDVLVDRGDMLVHHTLARNAGAQFSETGFATLVKNSETEEALAEKLGLRLDIPLELLRRLLAQATDLVRSRILASAPPEHQAKIQSAIASIANEVGREAASQRDFTRAETEANELNRRGKLNEAVLLQFVKERKYEDAVVTLALFCGVKTALIERLFKHVSSEGTIIACKAAKLTWPTTSAILASRFAHHSVSEEELGKARQDFLELSQAAAQRSIRFMQAHNVAKKTG